MSHQRIFSKTIQAYLDEVWSKGHRNLAGQISARFYVNDERREEEVKRFMKRKGITSLYQDDKPLPTAL